eukprot:TRINITY_DN2611_c0_g1_i1.p1 TRINITY_DN2611_c0_g1~~TRINITY_DN2611_c0_g1_i1.p1  ORF type:complete len:1037 (-),score=191.12 TRINITY_DN2611_c0_g1_i1:277-3387(-)
MQPLRQRNITIERLSSFVSGFPYDVNIQSRLYDDSRNVNLSVYSVPNLERIPYDEAIRQTFTPTQVGTSYGPAWSTHWFRVDFTVPSIWSGREVHLIFDTGSECLVYDNDEPSQGLTGGQGNDRRVNYMLIKSSPSGGFTKRVYVEMACNNRDGLGGSNGRDPADENISFTLQTANISVFNRDYWDLLWDIRVLADMAKMLPADNHRGNQALYIANKMVNMVNIDDRTTIPPARDLAKQFFSQKNGEGTFVVGAAGQCHIDTAWLWTYDETKRKCARSWSTALRMIDEYPDYVFIASQAQQFEWVKENYPTLFQRIQESVLRGRFAHVGATWVEMDCNMPSGESLCRQFLYGQRFFKKEFGSYCREFFLPDTFGYAAQLPQIMLGSRAEYFITIKLGWNTSNSMPASTFHWEGLDSSKVLAHFPSGPFNGMATVNDILITSQTFKDHARSNASMLLYGHGDGGGGPQANHLEQLNRMSNVNGLPIVEKTDVTSFMDRVKDEARDLTTWVGELYLEKHRGVYTTHAGIKRGNRKSESLMRDVEFLHTAGLLQRASTFPKAEIDRLWKLLLLNQFHDVLPGTSIKLAMDEALLIYEDIKNSAGELINNAIGILFPTNHRTSNMVSNIVAINSLGFQRTEVVEVPESVKFHNIHKQKLGTGSSLLVVSAPALGWKSSALDALPVADGTVSARIIGDNFVMENDDIIVTVTKTGHVSSVIDKRAQREVIDPSRAGNSFSLYDDCPLEYDAWDVEHYVYEKQYETGLATAVLLETGPIRATVEVNFQISPQSRLVQKISLTSVSNRIDFQTNVEWNESHKLLKVHFPLTIKSQNANCEVQYGHVQRPTHYNTSWDAAKFEVCAQKWVDLSEYGYGAAVLNDCKYGYSVHGNTISLSLLRSAKSPDPTADIGFHEFTYSFYPHLGGGPAEGGVVQEAMKLNSPIYVKGIASSVQEISFAQVDKPNIIIDCFKRAEDNGDLIIRLYESYGGTTKFKLTFPNLNIRSATSVNILEETIQPLSIASNSVSLTATPFQIMTLRFGF